MKSAKKSHRKLKSKTVRKTAPMSAKKSTNVFPVIPAEARRSTAAALLKHAPGWAGDDLDEVIEIVAETRTKARF